MIKFAPQKSSGNITLPKHIVPMANGAAQAKEHLAYISDAEAHMLRMLTDGKSNKTQFGPQSFTDPSQARGNTLSSKPTTTTSSPSRTVTAGKANNSSTVYQKPQLGINGGFGVAGFGKSTTTRNEIENALAAGMSGGVKSNPQMTSIGNGWKVGPGVVAGSKMFPDRAPGMGGVSLASVPQIPSTGKDQSRMLPGHVVANYGAYRQPPGYVAPSQMAQNTQNSMQGGLGAVGYGRSFVPGDSLTQMAYTPELTGSGLGARQVAAPEYMPNYNPNGPETPANGIDAMPAGGGVPSYAERYKTVGDQNANSPIVKIANAAQNIPLGKLALGAGSLYDRATGGLYGNSWATGAAPQQPMSDFGSSWHGDHAQNGPNALPSAGTNQAPPANPAGQTGQNPTAQKLPWYYPQYSQNWWNGLPSGLLGGYIG